LHGRRVGAGDDLRPRARPRLRRRGAGPGQAALRALRREPRAPLHGALRAGRAGHGFPRAQQGAQPQAAPLRLRLRQPPARLVNTPADARPFRPLATRLVFTVVAVCAICALLAMAMQGWQVWRDAARAQDHATRDIARGRLPLLATALWDIETIAVQRQLDEI